MLNPNLLVHVDGRFMPLSEAKVSVLDHGLLYGDGVFESLRAYGGVVFQLQEHMERLYRSARFLRLELPVSKGRLVETVLETLRKNELRDAYIRVILTRGEGDLGLDPLHCKEPNLIVLAEPVKHQAKDSPRGIKAVIASVRRDPVDATTHEAKSLNYLNSILAKWEAIEAGVDEAILLESRGFVSEASAANVFAVNEGEVLTPPTSAAILHGVTRRVVIELARNLGYRLIEKDVTPFELMSADELFLTGTLMELVAVVKVNGRPIGTGEVGPVTKRIYKAFTEAVRDPRFGVPIYPETTVAQK